MVRRAMHCGCAVGCMARGYPNCDPEPSPDPDLNPDPDPYQVRRVEYGWHTEFPDTLDALEVSK